LPTAIISVEIDCILSHFTSSILYNSRYAIPAKKSPNDGVHEIGGNKYLITYFQDKIGLTHYLFFVGGNGSGKSNNLTVFHFLGYRNMTSTDVTYANIYQFLGSRDEGIGTICEDEADGIVEDRVKVVISWIHTIYTLHSRFSTRKQPDALMEVSVQPNDNTYLL
jgi:hypothetical protein